MFYVYEYFIVDTLEVFYVGKGTGNRRFEMKGRNPYFKRILAKYNTAVRIYEFFDNEADAFKAEIRRIEELKNIGQAKTNLTYGGEGPSGLIHTDFSKKLMSIRRTGKAVGSDNPNYGKKFSEETRKKLSLSLKGKAAGEKNPMYGVKLTGEKNPFYGKRHTAETKAKISINRKGKGAQFGKDNPMFGKGFKGSDNPMYGKTGEKHPNSTMFHAKYLDGTSEKLHFKACEKKFGIAFTRIHKTGGTLHYKKKSKNDIYEGTIIERIEPVTTIPSADETLH